MQENSLLVLTSNQIVRAEENCKSGAQAFVGGTPEEFSWAPACATKKGRQKAKRAARVEADRPFCIFVK